MPFAWGHKTYVMGILNVTPDSFSGDGILQQVDPLGAAVEQARNFAAAGADIIDIGGESSRPGSAPVSPAEEIERILPVIKAVRQAVNIPISVDTYRAAVAGVVLDAGADWINDIWALRMDPALPKLIAQAGCPVILMHNRFAPRNAAEARRLAGHPHGTHYTDLIADVSSELQQSIDLALAQGIKKSRIIIDPGIGFGKTAAQNLQLINRLDRFKALGYPILLGPSRKRFIDHVLDLPPHERVEGTAAAVAIGIDRGADMVRVHDVAAIARIARMTDHIVRPDSQAIR